LPEHPASGKKPSFSAHRKDTRNLVFTINIARTPSFRKETRFLQPLVLAVYFPFKSNPARLVGGDFPKRLKDDKLLKLPTKSESPDSTRPSPQRGGMMNLNPI
jgi:hypothetical protein